MPNSTVTTVVKMKGDVAPVLDLTAPQFLNSLDYAILAVIIFSALISLWRGFTKEAFSLLVWLISMWVTIKFGHRLEPYFSFISESVLRSGLSYVAVFLVSLLIGGICNILISRFISGAGLGIADRFFGVFFGAGRGAVLIAVFVLISGVTSLPKESWWQTSVLIPHFQRAALWLRAYLPDNIRQAVQFPS